MVLLVILSQKIHVSSLLHNQLILYLQNNNNNLSQQNITINNNYYGKIKIKISYYATFNIHLDIDKILCNSKWNFFNKYYIQIYVILFFSHFSLYICVYIRLVLFIYIYFFLPIYKYKIRNTSSTVSYVIWVNLKCWDRYFCKTPQLRVGMHR